MAPESFHNSRATVETDVYAFGVLLLEVVCARKPGTQSMENDYNNSIVDWVWAHHRRDRLFEVVDFRLNGDFNREQVECVLMLALACCHPNPYERPSMRTALRVLTGEVDPPLIPFDKPVFMWPATAPPSFNEDLEYCSVSGGQMTPPFRAQWEIKKNMPKTQEVD
ncbi:putative L-type lectin-domain containing receptor kinase S.5 [Vitis vinifera]|uniref:Putative L-type lectin-domain containing receptor kinase S.5 n=1 Tax=Vitis vinifera TaxID=29760 RepID=A0A438HAL8_VITVI|nr:putative L-type lectin-domain containing receptor kinase S.5 [Vitis vinifera]